MVRLSTGASLLATALAVAFAVSGCGGSRPRLTTSAGRGVRAVAARPAKVPGVAPPPGAIAPSRTRLAKLARVSMGFAAHIRGLGNVSITQAIPTVSADLNRFWSKEFADSGIQWPSVQDVLVEAQPVLTDCSDPPAIAPTDPMTACPGATYTLYWTVPWMERNVAGGSGGVNLALGMAGLYSDAVMALFGGQQQLQQRAITAGAWQRENVCLDGIYARSLDERSLFEPADAHAVEKWLTTLSGGGGSAAASAAQLQRAFLAGFESGAPAACGAQAHPAPASAPTTTATTPTATATAPPSTITSTTTTP